MLDVRKQDQSRFIHLFIIHKSKKIKTRNNLNAPFYFSLMWEMLYSLPESGHPIVLLLLVTLFPIFCSLVLSLISLLPCPLFCFLFFPSVHIIFQLSSPPTDALLLLVVFFFLACCPAAFLLLPPRSYPLVWRDPLDLPTSSVVGDHQIGLT